MKGVRLAKDRALQLLLDGKYRRAAQAWAELIAEDPKSTYLRLRHAEACRRGGEYQAALASYRAAADLFEQSQQWSAAHAALRVALEIAPGDPQAGALLDRLERRRGDVARVAAKGPAP